MAQVAGNAHWAKPPPLFAHRARPTPLSERVRGAAGSKNQGIERWAPAAKRFIAYAPLRFPIPIHNNNEWEKFRFNMINANNECPPTYYNQFYLLNIDIYIYYTLMKELKRRNSASESDLPCQFALLTSLSSDVCTQASAFEQNFGSHDRISKNRRRNDR